MSQKLSFEAAMQRLNDIVDRLEKEPGNLEQSLALFEEGLALVKQCDTQLKGYENKVNELMVKYQDEPKPDELP
jgi:exodeoxyribonuclease VII small subunit